jgi:hypothetical protein
MTTKGQLLFLMILLFPFALSGQNKFIPPDPYTQWDGLTHWSRYQISAPAYLGPNALPVPIIHKARIPEKFYWLGQYEYFFGPGDQTHDFLTHFIAPIANGRVGLEFKYVPVELFSTDQIVSKTRRTMTGEATDGKSFGDIYFGTIIQLLKDKGAWPDLTFAMSCRTASGTGRENSRHTDGPGYYLDASAGDTYGKDVGFFRHLRWYVEIGFYCWQTNLDNYPQNDALLYGGGIDFDFKDFFINQSLCGYTGYMNNGDQPIVYRADIGIKIGNASLVAGYEKGLQDFPFQSIRAGFVINGFTGK